jgi:hypothetical protein
LRYRIEVLQKKSDSIYANAASRDEEAPEIETAPLFESCKDDKDEFRDIVEGYSDEGCNGESGRQTIHTDFANAAVWHLARRKVATGNGDKNWNGT